MMDDALWETWNTIRCGGANCAPLCTSVSARSLLGMQITFTAHYFEFAPSLALTLCMADTLEQLTWLFDSTRFTLHKH